MSAMSAHELVQTRNCRWPNCPGDAAGSPTHGPYANLCPACRRTQRERLSRAQSHGADAPRVDELEGVTDDRDELARRRPERTPRGPGDLEAAVKALAPLARRLETVHRNYRSAKAVRAGVFDDFKQALEDVKRATEELLAS